MTLQTRLQGQTRRSAPTVNPLRCCIQHLVPLRQGDNTRVEIPHARFGMTQTTDKGQTHRYAPYGSGIKFAHGNPPAKGNIKKKSGTVWATARVSSNRGIRTKVSERVCHTMMGVREASSFVPEIGTADTSGKRRSTECSHDVARAKNGSDLLNPCAGSFCNFFL